MPEDPGDMPVLSYATPRDAPSATLQLLLKAAAVTASILLVSTSAFFFIMVWGGEFKRLAGSAVGAALAIAGAGFLIVSVRMSRLRH